MTAIAVKPSRIVTPSGNGAAKPQLAVETLAPGMARLDEALAVLQAHKRERVATDIDERIALLAEIRQRMAAIGERRVAAILDAKGTTNDAFGVGEEWANYALALRWMRLLQRSLQGVAATRCAAGRDGQGSDPRAHPPRLLPRLGRALRRLPGGTPRRAPLRRSAARPPALDAPPGRGSGQPRGHLLHHRGILQPGGRDCAAGQRPSRLPGSRRGLRQ
jgi:hypothetical protein